MFLNYYYYLFWGRGGGEVFPWLSESIGGRVRIWVNVSCSSSSSNSNIACSPELDYQEKNYIFTPPSAAGGRGGVEGLDLCIY